MLLIETTGQSWRFRDDCAKRIGPSAGGELGPKFRSAGREGAGTILNVGLHSADPIKFSFRIQEWPVFAGARSSYPRRSLRTPSSAAGPTANTIASFFIPHSNHKRLEWQSSPWLTFVSEAVIFVVPTAFYPALRFDVRFEVGQKLFADRKLSD